MNEHDALIAAILANPESDMPRLVYADWLQEQPSHIECSECKGEGSLIRAATESARLMIREDFTFPPDTPRPTPGYGSWEVIVCPKCKGKKYVPTCYQERAEFILAQCDLYRLQADTAENIGRRDLLKSRITELGNTHEKHWFAVVRDLLPCTESYFVRFRRGFVSKVHAPIEWLRGRPCENCDGTGLVDTDRHEQAAPCPDCGGEFTTIMDATDRGYNPGTGRTGGNLRELIKTQPIEFVGVTDREPMRTRDDGRYTWWGLSPSDNDDLHPQSNLPRQVLYRLKRRSPSIYAAIYATREDACKDLSEALLSEAREG